MKRIKVLSLIFAIILMLCFSGCKSFFEPMEEPDENITLTDEKPEENEQIITKKIYSTELSEEILDWTEVSRYAGDVDGDGANENVVLVTSMKRDSNGEFVMNDGQNWALYVDGKEDDYILFNNYINLGNVYFDVAEYYMTDGAVSQINIIISTGSDFSIMGYTFSKTEKCYEERKLYSSGDETESGINRMHTSIPPYVG